MAARRPIWIKKSLLLMVWFLLLAVCSGATCSRNRHVDEKNKDKAESYYQLALSYYQQQNPIEALRNLEDARKLDPTNPDVHYMFGIIYLGKKIYDKAEESFKEAIDSNKDYSDAYNGLAAVYMAQKRWDEAVKMLEKPASDIMYPYRDKVYDNMGWCYHMMGDYQKAVDHMIQATAENGRNCHAWYNLGRIYAEAGKYMEAQTAFTKATKAEKICQNFIAAYLELAQVAIKQEDYSVAKPALEKCVEIGKESPEGEKCRRYLEALPKAHGDIIIK